jgi:quinone-modifying oxidoreductase, subunit QmoB
MAPLPELTRIPRVLIEGEGPMAEALAHELGSLGYTVVPCRGIIRGIDGFAGDFRVTLGDEKGASESLTEAGQGRESREQVGAIVFAPELEHEGRYEEYGTGPSEQIITLERLLPFFPNTPMTCETRSKARDTETMGDNDTMGQALSPGAHVAFLLGFYSEGNVVDMHLALHLALEIRKTCQSPVYVFCRNVKVAEEGLERLYQACRDEGILFFKFDAEGPDLRRQGDRVVLHFTDAVLEQPFELTPDLLVIDSAHQLPGEIREAARATGIGLDRSGYLQSANVHQWPQASQREGIFLAGPGKGLMRSGGCLEEARTTALSVHHFFEGRLGDPMDREVTVDTGLCTTCLTCFRFCPHQAVGWTHRVFIHPLACRRCGICASECPMDAIQISGYSDQEIGIFLKGLREKWGREEASEARVVVFGCRRSAGAAWKEVQGSGYTMPGEVEFLELPCAGKLDPDYVLQALSFGADGVLVLACPEENCKSVHGNTYARDRIQEAGDYLIDAGLRAEQLRFEWVSSNQVWKFKEIIGEFLDDLQKIRNPHSAIQNQK